MKHSALPGSIYFESSAKSLLDHLNSTENARLFLRGLVGSSSFFCLASLYKASNKCVVYIANTEQEAAYAYTDLVHLLSAQEVFFLPASKTPCWIDSDRTHSHDLMRSETLHVLDARTGPLVVITYPEALSERVVDHKRIHENTLSLHLQQSYVLDEVAEFLLLLGFYPVDFVQKPGQYSIRGGILDIFSYADEYPFRVEFFGDLVESIRSFDVATQRSIKKLGKITILPNLQGDKNQLNRISFFDFISSDSLLWLQDSINLTESIRKHITLVSDTIDQNNLHDVYTFYEKEGNVLEKIKAFRLLEQSAGSLFSNRVELNFNQTPQPLFKKNFQALFDHLKEKQQQGVQTRIFFSNSRQSERLYNISENLGFEDLFVPVYHPISEGFIDHDQQLACYADHQIFERYHRFKLKEGYQKAQQNISLKDLISLEKGDYVVHIQHGIGVYDGLEKIIMDGKTQEAMRVVYKDNDLLYVNIHSLHKISKYTGKEGKKISLDRLGSKSWQTLKLKAKKKVKEVAFDLIQLYAERKSQKGFAYNPDNYLQLELESSFIYEDTPDQSKASQDVKVDMEKPYPMDRLVCGDVGFGKTEVAIRAAFKAALDGKQVAILAPTTILTLQHFKTFQKRLEGFPCTVDYLNRFKSPVQQKETLVKLKEGKIDIIIGTHRLVSKDVIFKDLGLLIIDEEHKFGVGVKETLKNMRKNIDTLTLTATPIPRTLQFSLMSARDLSVISTPPANRQPVQTEIHTFQEGVIQEAIYRELARGGQVFFIHNRVQSLPEVASMIQRICPEASVGIGHGQMKPEDLEKTVVQFMDGAFDILVSTTIVESGLDISNANTIIIQDAHMFGLSDLHQMRGRVGRSNLKAYCILLSPPLSVLPSDAKKRLKVIEQFSDLGSGFQIAMRDLDIRGAGDLLGGEQSGFISDIGYETYHKILDEAIKELKQKEFKEVFTEEIQDSIECHIDTDLELLFPDSYIQSVSERLSLYKDMAQIDQESKLDQFKEQLLDRFGSLPLQAEELLNSMKLKWLAEKNGFEKLVLKSKMLSAYFLSTHDASFYTNGLFQRILQNLSKSPSVQIKQKNDRVFIQIKEISSVSKALEWFNANLSEAS